MTTIYIAVRYSTPTDFAIFGPYASEGEAQKSAADSMYPTLGFTEALSIVNVLDHHRSSAVDDATLADSKTYYCFSNRDLDVPDTLISKLAIEAGDPIAWEDIHSTANSKISEAQLIAGILNHLEPPYANMWRIKERHSGAIKEVLGLGVFDRVCCGTGLGSRRRLLDLKKWTKKTSSAVVRGKFPESQDTSEIETEFWNEFVIDGSSGPVDDGESYSYWSGLAY